MGKCSVSGTDSFVYIICVVRGGKEVAPCKIGISDRPADRLRGLQTSHFEELKLYREYRLPSREIASEVESCFHYSQSGACLRGEWFNLVPQKAAALLDFQIILMLDAFTSIDPGEALELVVVHP